MKYTSNPESLLPIVCSIPNWWNLIFVIIRFSNLMMKSTMTSHNITGSFINSVWVKNMTVIKI